MTPFKNPRVLRISRKQSIRFRFFAIRRIVDRLCVVREWKQISVAFAIYLFKILSDNMHSVALLCVISPFYRSNEFGEVAIRPNFARIGYIWLFKYGKRSASRKTKNRWKMLPGSVMLSGRLFLRFLSVNYCNAVFNMSDTGAKRASTVQIWRNFLRTGRFKIGFLSREECKTLAMKGVGGFE